MMNQSSGEVRRCSRHPERLNVPSATETLATTHARAQLPPVSCASNWRNRSYNKMLRAGWYPALSCLRINLRTWKRDERLFLLECLYSRAGLSDFFLVGRFKNHRLP